MDGFSSRISPFVSKQAVARARQGIAQKAFLELFRLSVRQFYSLSSGLHAWNSFHIYAVDGSTIQIPESKENYEVFGSNSDKAEKISPLASVSLHYDVKNDILVDVSLHSCRYNERESSLFTYPSSGNKGSLTWRSIHFLLENGNIEYLVINLMIEQMAVANFQIYTDYKGS